MEGQYCALTPLDPKAHAEGLFNAFAKDAENIDWTYLPYGPFESLPALQAWLEEIARQSDPLFYTLMDRQGKAVGVASYLRISPANGSIEVGHIHYSPQLQKTPAATEAMYLMMKHAFVLGYRRYEWKCDALNQRSRRAALRLGLSYEGIFRQATVYKGRNRDTAWYATIDLEWPKLKTAFETWLDPANFDASGKQKISLSDLTAPVLVASE
tara:strand:- start:96 stop:731 length:636 start_codon:yes stop_codon:yes gene_type:complete